MRTITTLIAAALVAAVISGCIVLDTSRPGKSGMAPGHAADGPGNSEHAPGHNKH